MSETVFLKLGGSLITDKAADQVFLADRVAALGAEIREAMDARPMRLLLGHGAGCFGHAPAKRYRVREGLAGGGGWLGYARTRREVMRLNGLMLDAFERAGFHPMAIQPSASAMASGGALRRMDLAAVEGLWRAGQVPMVFGDAVLDDKLGFTIASTEGLFAWLADRLKPHRIVLACDVDGVFRGDPKTQPEAERVGVVNSANLDDVLARLGAGPGADVTGGMAGKVRTLHALARRLPATEIRIVSGAAPGRVREALLGRGGGSLVQA